MFVVVVVVVLKVTLNRLKSLENLFLGLPLFKFRPSLREIYRIRRVVRRAKKNSQ